MAHGKAREKSPNGRNCGYNPWPPHDSVTVLLHLVDLDAPDLSDAACFLFRLEDTGFAIAPIALESLHASFVSPTSPAFRAQRPVAGSSEQVIESTERAVHSDLRRCQGLNLTSSHPAGGASSRPPLCSLTSVRPTAPVALWLLSALPEPPLDKLTP
ncbi:hypothetical protein KM043_006539 [Ampulex compressa]|nr:hypothetical protein KM043_006539 [Ampulex compressa]